MDIAVAGRTGPGRARGAASRSCPGLTVAAGRCGRSRSCLAWQSAGPGGWCRCPGITRYGITHAVQRPGASRDRGRVRAQPLPGRMLLHHGVWVGTGRKCPGRPAG